MEASWSQGFNVTDAGGTTLSFDYRLMMTGEYESDEIGSRLKDVFKFKNLNATARALRIEPQNMTNLNNGKSSEYAEHLVLAIIELAKELPLKKRRQIINNIDFRVDT